MTHTSPIGIGLRRDLVVVLLALAMAAMAVGLGGSRTPARAETFLSPQVVLDWNINAVNAVRGSSPAKLQADGQVYMAYVQAAVYDAVTKIDGRYVPYHDFSADTTGASVQAAVVAAAYNTLLAYIKAPAALINNLTLEYNASLASLPDEGKAAGIAVGKAAADDLVQFRSGDGLNAPVSTPYGQCSVNCPPGLWVFVPPPAAQVAAVPWLGFMRPFLLQSPSQFRAEPPPDLTSEAYLRDLDETRAFGAIDSTVRTPEQTAVAYFWLGHVVNQNSKAYRDFATAHGYDLVDTARLLAMGMLVSADSLVACFDSKYTYQFWRPLTAIRDSGDPTWTPLAVTPQHPEYPSAHGCDAGSMGEVFAAAAGTRQINVDIWGGQGGSSALTTKRHYETVKDLEEEMENARVWVGYHFRGSVEEGISIGQKVARWSLQRYFLPVESE